MSNARVLRLEIPGFDMFLDDAVGHREELLGAGLGAGLSLVDLRGGDVVFLPVPAVVAVVQEQRLQVVHRVGELGLCRLCGFKLIEQRDQLRFLLRRKEGEDAFLGLVFALLLRFRPSAS